MPDITIDCSSSSSNSLLIDFLHVPMPWVLAAASYTDAVAAERRWEGEKTTALLLTGLGLISRHVKLIVSTNHCINRNASNCIDGGSLDNSELAYRPINLFMAYYRFYSTFIFVLYSSGPMSREK